MPFLVGISQLPQTAVSKVTIKRSPAICGLSDFFQCIRKKTLNSLCGTVCNHAARAANPVTFQKNLARAQQVH